MSNQKFVFQDKNGNTGTVEPPSDIDYTKLNKLFQAVNVILNTSDLNGLVHKSGNESITGIKTFTALPQSSVTPSDNKDLTNKAYVDGLADTKANTTSVYTKTEADNKFALIEDIPDISDLSSGSSLPEGTILESSVPQSDINLYPTNGSKFSRNGIYADFVDKMKSMYTESLLKAYSANGDTVYIKDSEITESTQLYNSKNVLYTGSTFEIGTDNGEPAIIHNSVTNTIVNSNTPNEELKQNYTVLGTTVTDDNGVISGTFNATNYVLGDTVLDTSGPFEIKTKLTPKSVGTAQDYFNLNSGTSEAIYSFLLETTKSAKFALYVSSNGSSWNICNASAGTYTLVADTPVWIKAGWSGTEYYLEYSLDGETYTRDITVSSTVAPYNLRTAPRFGRAWSSAPMLHLLDLNETSFSSNSTTWLARYYYTSEEVSTVATRNSSKDISTSEHFIGNTNRYNYIANSDDIFNNNGIISGFISTTGNAVIPFKQPSTSAEIVIKLRQPTITATTTIIGKSASGAYMSLMLRVTATTGQLNIWTSSNGTSWNIASNVDTGVRFAPNVWNYYKLTWDGTTYTSYQSFDGVNWITRNSTASALPLYGVNNLLLGGDRVDSYPFTNGQIDLNESYIKIDGSPYWTGVTELSKDDVFNTEVLKYGCCDKYIIEDNGDLRIPYIKYDKRYSYIVTGGSVKSSSQINLENYINDLNNKVNSDDLVEAAVVVESYRNDSSWYRLYSDGWCEQGGRYSLDTTGVGTIELLMPFRDTSFSIFNCKTSSDASTWNVMFGSISAWTKSSVPIKANLTGYNLSGSWVAMGYIDLEE